MLDSFACAEIDKATHKRQNQGSRQRLAQAGVRNMEPTQELVDDIYRERVLRARRTPPIEKLLDGPRLFAEVCERMKAGLRDENPGADEDRIRELLLRRIAILRRLDESR